MQYKIRKTNDLELIQTLNAEIFPQDLLHTDHKTAAWVLYDDKDEPVAFCTCRNSGYGILFMDRAGIKKEHRKKGLHRKLIKAREAYAKKNGFKKIITYVMKENYASLFTLVRCDYEMYTPEYKYAGENVIYVIKEFK